MADETDPNPLATLSTEVAQLRDLFQRRLLEDRAKQRLYDELYSQLELAKSDLAAQFVTPLAREVLLVVDRVDAGARSATDSAVGESLRSICHELLEIFRRRGLRAVEAVGTAFDPRVHEAVESVPVDAAEDHGRVLDQRRTGYLLDSRLVRPAQVVVGHHSRGTAAEPGS